MNSVIKLQMRIIFIDVILLAVCCVLALILADQPKPWILGFVFGGLIGILNFILLGNTMNKASRMNPNSARAYASANYFARMALIAIVIIIALKADYLNVIAVIIGLLLIKQIIIFSQIFNNKQFFRNIFHRKEDK